MTPWEILAVKLPDADITEEQRLSALAEMEQEILNYCNIEAVPGALAFTWANMAADLLRYQRAANKPAAEEDSEAALAGKVSSISEGDTAVSFGNKSEAESDRERLLGGHREMLNGLIFNYREQLQQFRKVAF